MTTTHATPPRQRSSFDDDGPSGWLTFASIVLATAGSEEKLLVAPHETKTKGDVGDDIGVIFSPTIYQGSSK